MRFLYDIAFICFAICYMPFFLLRLRQAASKRTLLTERCGFIARSIRTHAHTCVWIHAVSVGEVLSLRVFIEELFRKYESIDVCVSVVTPTGHAVAKSRLDNRVRLFYCPFDISYITNHVMRIVQPQALILVETELWPNLIYAAYRNNVPVCVINGRLSPRSFRRYYRFRGVLRSMIDMLTVVAVQNERYKKRFLRIGVPHDRVLVTGTMKFDVLAQKRTVVPYEFLAEWKRSCGFAEDSRVIIAASTHDPEEALCMAVYQRLQKEYPDLRLVIVPRHIDRAEAIQRVAEAKGFRVRCAEVRGVIDSVSSACDVYIVNTIGHLAQLYAYCDYVVMGGSFLPHGGQNPLEAAVQGKPIVTGVHHFNFPDVYHDMLKRHAVLIARDEKELFLILKELIANGIFAYHTVEAAASFVDDRRGASRKNADVVASVIMQASRRLK